MKGNSRRCAVASQGVCRNETVASTRFLIGPRVRPIDPRASGAWLASCTRPADGPFPIPHEISVVEGITWPSRRTGNDLRKLTGPVLPTCDRPRPVVIDTQKRS